MCSNRERCLDRQCHPSAAVTPTGACMKVGLINRTGNYLTVESYQNCVNTLGVELGRKQVWELTHRGNQGCAAVVALQSCHGDYLLVDNDGTVRCGYPSPCQQSLFLLNLHAFGDWILKSMCTEKYLESDGENVFCCSPNLTCDHRWMPHLAMHAHIALYNMTNNCYARVDPTIGKILVDLPEPYLEESGFLLRFCNGLYHLETSDHKFVSREDTLEETPSSLTAFTLHLKPGCVARFSDGKGCIFYPQGRQRLLCLGACPNNMEEWFLLKRLPAWVYLKACNRRFVSIVCGVEVGATTKCLTPQSVFLYEMDCETNSVRLSGINGCYLARRRSQSIMANGNSEEEDSCFIVWWHCGKICLRASNCAYLTVQPVGLIVTCSTQPGPDEEFVLRLCNRAYLLLRSRYGYIGTSVCQGGLQCNQPDPLAIELTPCRQATYHFGVQGGRFWQIRPDGSVTIDGHCPQNFYIEIRGTNFLAVLAPNGYYLRGDQCGSVVADCENIIRDCLWEF
ncbi:fascin-3 [Ambystoma mexicanum]|uniref:fascin-3 n=1 Tax=Ambystoma mexicanum TaxID=8296 RepID=UPI0037E9BF1F